MKYIVCILAFLMISAYISFAEDISYIVYRNSDGIIVRKGTIRDSDYALQPIPAGHTKMQYLYTNENKVVNGVPVYVYIPPTPQQVAEQEEIENISLAQRKSFVALFYIVNEIRKLNSQPTITKAQFKNWLLSQ